MKLHALGVLLLFSLCLLGVLEVSARLVGFPERVQPVQFVDGVGHVNDPVTLSGPVVYGGNCHILLLGDSILDDLKSEMSSVFDMATKANPDMTKCKLTNVSIGGWSPSGIRKWVETFGWQDATQVIFVFNSDDLEQPPHDDRRAMSATYDKHDRLALTAWFKSTILRRIDNRLRKVERFSGAGKPDMEKLVLMADADVGNVQILWHPRLSDTLSGARPPETFVQASERVNAPLHRLEYDPTDYTDRIHLNESGQSKMASQLAQILTGSTQDSARLDLSRG